MTAFFFSSQTSKNLKIPFRIINFPFIVTQTYAVQSSLCKHTCSFKLAFVNKLGFFGCLLRLGSSVPWGKKKERFTSIYGLIFRHAEYLLWTLRAVPLEIRSLMWCWKKKAQGKRSALIFKHKCLYSLGKRIKWINKPVLKCLVWNYAWAPYFRLSSQLKNARVHKSTDSHLFCSITRICLATPPSQLASKSLKALPVHVQHWLERFLFSYLPQVPVTASSQRFLSSQHDTEQLLNGSNH